MGEKLPPSWAGGAPVPTGYVDWWDWLDSLARSLVSEVEERATEPAWVLIELDTGKRYSTEARLREVDDEWLMRRANLDAKIALASAFVPPSVTRADVALQAYNHAKDWLIKHGYTLV